MRIFKEAERNFQKATGSFAGIIKAVFPFSVQKIMTVCEIFEKIEGIIIFKSIVGFLEHDIPGNIQRDIFSHK